MSIGRLADLPFTKAGSLTRLPLITVTVLSLAASAGVAQDRPTLHGLLIEDGSDAPVDGATIQLLASDDRAWDEAISREGGGFTLGAPGPGVFRLRVKRIGYATWESANFRIGTEGLRRRFEIPVEPVPLPELVVSDSSLCPTTVEERRRAFILYQSLRPTLEMISSGDERNGYLYAVRVIRRKVVWRRGGRSYDQDTSEVLLHRAIATPAPSSLATFGYASAINDTLTTFYAPDSRTLLSSSFLATHCLSVRTHPDEDRVGLSFEPKPGRAVVDVEGTIWVNSRGLTAVVAQRLQYTYTNVEPFLRQHQFPLLLAEYESRGDRVSVGRIQVDNDRFGGSLVFSELPDGSWITTAWEIAAPNLIATAWFGANGVDVQPRAIPLRTSATVLALVPRDRVPATVEPDSTVHADSASGRRYEMLSRILRGDIGTEILVMSDPRIVVSFVDGRREAGTFADLATGGRCVRGPLH